MTELAGRRGAPFPMLVEEGKSREFRRATTPLAWADAVDDSGLSPVTFLASARLWLTDEDSAWHGIQRDYRRILHGEQQFTFRDGPVPVGSRLTGTERIDRAYTKSGSRGAMLFTDTVTDFVLQDEPSGEPVATARATSITLEAAAGPGSGTPDGASVDPPPPPDEHVVLDEFTDAPWSVTDFVRYQGASGDFNPIHHDTEFAIAAGYPGPFAVGMLTAGLAASVVSRHGDVGRLRCYTTRWRSQAWPGDALRYRTSLAPTAAEADGRRLTVDVIRPTGHLHMRARAEFARPA